MHVADRAQGLGHIDTSIYYCCKSFPVLLHDVMVGGWIASYEVRVHFYFWSRCCCCCCVLLLLPTTQVLKRREVPPTVSSFSVSATIINTFLCVYSIAVAAVEKGYAFLFFGGGAAAAAANHFSCWLLLVRPRRLTSTHPSRLSNGFFYSSCIIGCLTPARACKQEIKRSRDTE